MGKIRRLFTDRRRIASQLRACPPTSKANG